MSKGSAEKGKVNGTNSTIFDDVKKELGRTACGPIKSALPQWPANFKTSAQWVGLDRKTFSFSHHASESPSGRDNKDNDNPFCAPVAESRRLLSVLEKSRGGSVLVTGYRGTGKTSIVNHAISRFKEQKGEKRNNAAQPVNQSQLQLRVYIKTMFQYKTWRTLVLPVSLVLMLLAIILEQYILSTGNGLFSLITDSALPYTLNPFYLMIGFNLVCINAAWLTISYLLKFPEDIEKARKVEEKKLQKESSTGKNVVDIRINLSTARTAQALVDIMLKELYLRYNSGEFAKIEKIREAYDAYRGSLTDSRTEKHTAGISLKGVEAGVENSQSQSYTHNPYNLHETQRDIVEILRQIRTEHGMQVIFVFDELDKLIPADKKVQTTSASRKMLDLQNIVSDLRFLLTEAEAHYIFIAGKDVDDSWQEDQNKGEGLFESVFVQNIYNPSLLTAKLQSNLDGHTWITEEWRRWLKSYFLANPKTWPEYIQPLSRVKTDPALNIDALLTEWADKEMQPLKEKLADGLFQVILQELGTSSINWTYNTGLLILPHLTENELRRIIVRVAKKRYKTLKETSFKDLSIDAMAPKDDPGLGGSEFIEPFITWLAIHLFAPPEKSKECKECKEGSECRECKERKDAAPLYNFSMYSDHDRNFITGKTAYGDKPVAATERRCRRLRYLFQYLTYKGRGIPRKILREFYTLIRHRESMGYEEDYWKKRGNPEYIVYIPSHLRQKIKFFANIVSRLDSNQDIFRSLDDKGVVAIFHIIDYILKFYQTGFSWSDIENANFMAEREEIFPSRELAAKLLDLLEDVLIERVDRRQRTYMLLPRIKHDLAGLYLAFGPEQIELRFTRAEYEREINELNGKLKHLNITDPPQRLESFTAQIRLAQIYELLGDIPEARMAYSKALRWIRMDIERLITNGTEPKDEIQKTTAINYLNTGIEVLQRLGYLHELARDFKPALHYYQTAVKFHEYIWQLNDEKSLLLGCRICARTPDTHSPHYPSSAGNSIHIPSEGNPPHAGDTLYAPMVPTHQYNSHESIFPFTSNGPFHEQHDSRHQVTIYSALDSSHLPRTLNMMAIVLDKAWYRYAANRSLLLALDYYRAMFDRYKVFEQMIFIGEILVRRRDIRLAARWYHEALVKLVNSQTTDPVDLVNKQPQLQSSIKAKLFDHLGDIYTATNGTAFIKGEALSKSPEDIRKAVSASMRRFRNTLKSYDMLEDRDDEYFYTLAAQHYAINHQGLRECDIYIKKLDLRFQRLRSAKGIFAKVRCWCSFWDGANKAISALVDMRPFVRYPRESGPVTDRRRYGKLLAKIGHAMVYLSRSREDQTPEEGHNLLQYYWEDDKIEKWKNSEERRTGIQKIYKSDESDIKQLCRDEYKAILEHQTDLAKARDTINRIFGEIVKCPTLETGDHICSDNTLSQQSLLWNLKATKWGEVYESLFNQLLPGEPGDDTPVNTFIMGQIYYLCKYILSKLDGDTSEIVKLENECRTLYRAELAYLAAHLSLDDNIRDLDAAETCRSIGVLYLRGIELLIDLRKHILKNNAMPGKEYAEESLSYIYAQLHIAAKRFLVSAIDIFRSEKQHNRCMHSTIGLTYRALGDLMMLRQEIVASNMVEKLETSSIDALNNWSSVGEYLQSQKPHIADLDLEDCRYQVCEAYKEALRHYLSEISDYTKRYRFNNETYFFHGNVMDRHMHYEICKQISRRHWHYESADSASGIAEKYSEHLSELSRRISVRLFEPFPDPGDRQSWFMAIKRILDLVILMSPHRSYLSIPHVLQVPLAPRTPRILSQKPALNSCTRFSPLKKYDIVLGGTDCPEDFKAYSSLKHFFRSYNDKLTQEEDAPEPAHKNGGQMAAG